MKPDTEYSQNLSYYLEHSDEDIVDSITFLREFPIKHRTTRSTLSWLDVGMGPGTKPIKILKGVRNYKGLIDQFTKIHLDALEPSKIWQKIFIQNFKTNNLKCIIRTKYLTIWEKFSEKRQYDLITFFHSVYGIRTETLANIPRFLKNGGVGCIVVESPDSDLHKIKKSIYPFIHHRELASSAQTIESFLKDARINHKLSKKEPKQKFYVDELIDINNLNSIVPLSFILQTKPENHNKIISIDIQRKINNELKKFVKKDKKGRFYLNVPDRFIWVYK